MEHFWRETRSVRVSRLRRIMPPSDSSLMRLFALSARAKNTIVSVSFGYLTMEHGHMCLVNPCSDRDYRKERQKCASATESPCGPPSAVCVSRKVPFRTRQRSPPGPAIHHQHHSGNAIHQITHPDMPFLQLGDLGIGEDQPGLAQCLGSRPKAVQCGIGPQGLQEGHGHAPVSHRTICHLHAPPRNCSIFGSGANKIEFM